MTVPRAREGGRVHHASILNSNLHVSVLMAHVCYTVYHTVRGNCNSYHDVIITIVAESLY